MASYNYQIIQPFNMSCDWLNISHTIDGLHVQQGRFFSIQKEWKWVSIFILESFIRLWCPINDVGPNQHWWVKKTWTKFILDSDINGCIHYYKSWFFKRFKLTNLSFWLMDMYILTKGQGLEWHIICWLINLIILVYLTKYT